ncbi:MAG: aliphatic sulfonate ABC transporter substrate-binding protein [Methylotetracoccus sp.]
MRIGFQKYGTLILVKERGELDRRLKERGVAVHWAEFAYGPPMLEALNANRLDFASSGETPPVYALAAQGSDLAYVGYQSAAPAGEAVLVDRNSPVRGLAELRGRKIAVARGSNAHYLLTRALLSSGLQSSDIDLVYLTPAEARSAFESGAVDAWAVWDFHLAAAETSLHARILIDGRSLVDNHEVFTSRAAFVREHAELIDLILDEIAQTDAWTRAHVTEAAELLNRRLNIGVPVLQKALERRGYGVHKAGAELARAQQAIADTLWTQKLLPRRVDVAEAFPTLRVIQ